MDLSVILAAAMAVTVIDGDTVTIDHERIRIANIDAPEIGHPKCDAELRLAEVAKARLGQLLGAGPIDIRRGDPADGRMTDRYGRTLAVISVGGRDVGQVLIAEQLARPWQGRRRSWCEGAH